MGSDLIHQLFYRDNWDVVEWCLNTFDKMPTTMRVIVDLKISGDTNSEVAEKMRISENNVRAQLSRAKKMIARSLETEIQEF